MESAVYIDTRPPYPKEIARKPLLTTHSHDHELRLREFSKS